MSISDIIRRSGRSLKNAKARTILTAMAIAVGTFALTLTLAASNGAQGFVDEIISENFDPAELIVANDNAVFGRGDTTKPKEYNQDFSGALSQAGAPIQIEYINDEQIEQIKTVTGVNEIREGIDLNLEYLTRTGQKKYIGTVSVFNPFQKPDILAGEIPKKLTDAKVLLPEAFLEPLGFKSAVEAVGKQIVLAVRKPADPDQIRKILQKGVLIDQAELDKASQSQVSEEVFTISAILKKPTTSQPGTELYSFIGIDDAKRINDLATKNTDIFRKYQYVFVNVKDGDEKTVLKGVQDKLKEMGFVTQSAKDTQEFLFRIIGILQGIVAAFGMIAVIASVFGIVNTMYISVLQRTREIGLMKALGMRSRDISRLFRFEAAWIGFLGGAIGSLLALLVGSALNPWITKQLDLGEDKLLVFKPTQIIILIVLLMIVATLAGLLPARKAAKLDPIEALRTE